VQPLSQQTENSFLTSKRGQPPYKGGSTVALADACTLHGFAMCPGGNIGLATAKFIFYYVTMAASS
jgi:hypothetical protein